MVMAEFGIRCDLAFRQALLKDDSIACQLSLSFYESQSPRKLTIKLEIDKAPPHGSEFEYRYHNFPLDVELCTRTLASNFSLKIHALPYRTSFRGRDWFDFSWYASQSITPNLFLFENALRQYGPWAEKHLSIDKEWLNAALSEKISSIDWSKPLRTLHPSGNLSSGKLSGSGGVNSSPKSSRQ